MKIAVIGAGISGVSVAKMLHMKHEVTVYEKEKIIGGLVKCTEEKGNLFHNVGGHVFNSKNVEILKWFWANFDKNKEFILAKRNAKILLGNDIIGYPIENYLYQLNPVVTKKILSELVEIQKKDIVSPLSYNNFELFLKGSFGDTLYDLYFKPYNEKIWQMELNSIPMEWLEGKLPMPDLLGIILSNVIREEEKDMVHSYFYYPKKGGSQFIIDRLAKGLDIRNNSTVNNIEIDNNKLILNGEYYDKIIYTGDIRKLSLICKDISITFKDDIEKINKLKSNGTSNLLCETDNNNYSWLYIPDPFIKAHRIIYTGNFSEANNANLIRKSCVVEFSGYVKYEDMVKEIIYLPGNLTPIAYNYEPNSYIIQDFDTRNEIEKIKKKLSNRNIFLLGRFAEWEYYNMDKAIEAAMKLSKEI